MTKEQIEKKIKLYENKIEILSSIERQAKEKVLSRVERQMTTRRMNYENAIIRLKQQLSQLENEN